MVIKRYCHFCGKIVFKESTNSHKRPSEQNVYCQHCLKAVFLSQKKYDDSYNAVL